MIYALFVCFWDRLCNSGWPPQASGCQAYVCTIAPGSFLTLKFSNVLYSSPQPCEPQEMLRNNTAQCCSLLVSAQECEFQVSPLWASPWRELIQVTVHRGVIVSYTKYRLRKTPDILKAGKYWLRSTVLWIGKRCALPLPTTRLLKEHNGRYLTGKCVEFTVCWSSRWQSAYYLYEIKNTWVSICHFFIKIIYCHIKSS